MEINARRLRLVLTSLMLAALALGVLGIVLFGLGVQNVAADPGTAGTVSPGRGTTVAGSAVRQQVSPGGEYVVRAGHLEAAGLDDVTRVPKAAEDEVDLRQAYPGAEGLEGWAATAELAISKSDGVAVATPDDTLIYTIAVTYTGSSEISQVVVTDTLPVLTTYWGGTGGWERVGSTRAYTFYLGALTDGSTRTLTLRAKLADAVPAGLEAITNTVEVASDGSEGPLLSASDTDVDDVVAAPELVIIMTDGVTTVVPGDRMTYNIAIFNAGDRDATGVMVTDTLPVWTTYQGGTSGWRQVAGLMDTYTYTIGSLVVDDVRVLSLTVALTDTVPAGLKRITNTVEVADDGQARASATEVDTVVVPRELEISKTDDVASVAPGETLTYTIAVTNSGDEDATGVVVRDTLPVSTTFEGGTSGWKQVGTTDTYTYTIGGLAVDEVRVLSLTVALTGTVPAGIEVITNTVEVADDGQAYARDVDVDVVAAPRGLGISKTDSVAEVVPRQTLTYTIIITNSGYEDATDVVVTDTLPVSTTYQAGTTGWQQVGSTRAYTLSLDTLTQGTTRNLTLTVALRDTVPAGLAFITNTVEVADDGEAYASAADVDAVTAVPDLTISKTDGVTTVMPGQTVTYTLTISNVGTQDATGVVVTDTLPAAALAEYIQASHVVTYSDGFLEWTPFDLSAGSWATRTVTVRVADPPWPAGVEVLTNTATVSDDGTNGADPNPDDNTASDANRVGADPDLFISKTDNALTATAGELIVYTLLYRNHGTQDAKGVVITETVPANTAFNAGWSDPGWWRVGTTDRYTLSVGTLPVGPTDAAVFAVTVDAALPEGIETVMNVARIGDDGTSGRDLNPGDNSDDDVDGVSAAPDLTIAKTNQADSVKPDEILTYTLTISNTGTQGATGVVVSDVLPAHTAFLTASNGASFSAPVVTWSPFDLSVGERATRTVIVKVTATIPAGVETITNTASVADDGANGDDLDPLSNSTEDADGVSAAADLAIAKTNHVDSVEPDEILTYTLTISNTGTQGATGVVVSDVLPAHTTFVMASHPFILSDGVVTWQVLDLEAQSMITRVVVVQVDSPLAASIETITNTATVAGDEGVGDSAVDVDSVLAAPDLALGKTDGRSRARPGETLTYTVTVENHGTQEATGVVLSDTLPAHTSFGAASDGGLEDGGVVTWPQFALSAGATVTRTVTVQVAEPWPAGATAVLTNTVSVADDGANGADPVPGDNTAMDITRVRVHTIYLLLISKH
ncbi:MAG: hypothetical protein PVG71_05405 [Anaerolineae bacterium]|jgi:uncharacterized repeat protein (TIGR01451 family)